VKKLLLKGQWSAAQNLIHIFTPVQNKDEVKMVWGNTLGSRFPYLQCPLTILIFEHGESR